MAPVRLVTAERCAASILDGWAVTSLAQQLVGGEQFDSDGVHGLMRELLGVVGAQNVRVRCDCCGEHVAVVPVW